MAADRSARQAPKDARPGATADPWVSQMRKGLLEFLILALLKGGEAYGYEILRQLQGLEGLALRESTIYPLLARLTRDGLLKARQMRSLEGPPRRYYSLTKAGLRRLAEMTRHWRTINGSVEEILRAAERA